jgi:hypothetical protein
MSRLGTRGDSPEFLGFRPGFAVRAASVLLPLAACKPFQRSRRGERWPAIASARVVEDQAAAKAVGADLVGWEKIDRRTVTGLEMAPARPSHPTGVPPAPAVGG